MKILAMTATLLLWSTATRAQPDYQTRDEVDHLQTEVEHLKTDVVTLEARVAELEREADRNMRMWQKQLDHQTDEWLRRNGVNKPK